MESPLGKHPKTPIPFSESSVSFVPLTDVEWDTAEPALSLIDAVRELVEAHPAKAYTEDELLAELSAKGDETEGATPAGRWITAQKCGMTAEILVERGEIEGRYTTHENADGNEIQTIYYRSR